MACLRLVTGAPKPPLFNVPALNSDMVPFMPGMFHAAFGGSGGTASGDAVSPALEEDCSDAGAISTGGGGGSLGGRGKTVGSGGSSVSFIGRHWLTSLPMYAEGTHASWLPSRKAFRLQQAPSPHAVTTIAGTSCPVVTSFPSSRISPVVSARSARI